MDYKLLGQRIRASRLAAELSQEQFKQIIDEQPLDRKQMSVNVLRTIFLTLARRERSYATPLLV